MATTTNFGWETPDDTDLVKDGAAAMRTLGNSIDTSFVDLKGGTTGQVLAKASNTDLDFTWATDASGIPATIFDAKGDIIAATAADTASRLAVGTNGYVLTADSAEATGIKWAAIPSSTPTAQGCSVYLTGNVDITTATTTDILWGAEIFDTDSFHSTSTNTARLTVPAGLGGKYLLTVSIDWEGIASTSPTIYVDKNGTNTIFWNNLSIDSGSTNAYTQVFSTVLNLVAGDYIKIQARQSSGSNKTIRGSQVYNTNAQFMRLGA